MLACFFIFPTYLTLWKYLLNDVKHEAVVITEEKVVPDDYIHKSIIPLIHPCNKLFFFYEFC
jgi:hypothetical protein